MNHSLFTRIARREIPGVFVYEDDQVFAIMDKFPHIEGQVLVIPKEEIDSIFDIPDTLYTELWLVSKKIARAMEQALSPKRVCIIVEGFEVPHAHIRLYPVPEGKPLSLESGEEQTQEALEKTAERIRAYL